MPSVLMVLTGAKVWTMKDGTPHPTGFARSLLAREDQLWLLARQRQFSGTGFLLVYLSGAAWTLDSIDSPGRGLL